MRDAFYRVGQSLRNSGDEATARRFFANARMLDADFEPARREWEAVDRAIRGLEDGLP